MKNPRCAFWTGCALGVVVGVIATAAANGDTLDLPVMTPVHRPATPHSPLVVGGDGHRVGGPLAPDSPAPIPRPEGPWEAPPSQPPPSPDDPSDEPPPVFFGEPIETEGDTIVYVLDRSSSMIEGGERGVGMSKWERVREEAARSIARLADSFRFGVVLFDCSTEVWHPELAQATEANKAAAGAWLRSRLLGGGTGTAGGAAAGLAWRENRTLVLLSDGDPNCPWGASAFAEHRAAIRAANAQGAVINTFGIFSPQQDATRCRAFLVGVAADSGGRYSDVPF